MPVTGILIAHIGPQKLGVAFPVHGTFEVTSQSWVNDLEVQDDQGTTIAITTPKITYGVSVFTFTHPGFATAASYTVTVAAPGTGAKVVSNTFKVS
jgi:hypothetical protein